MNHSDTRQPGNPGQRATDSGDLNLPSRDPIIERVLSKTLESIFDLQGAKYDQNPSRNFIFSDLFRQNPYYHDAPRGDGTYPHKLFGYRLNSMKSDDDELIPIPRNRFWNLIRPMTSLLLSDRRTQHYTTVYNIDYSNGLLDLVDQWPDKIFLKAGFNTMGIEAQIIEIPDRGKIVRLTRADLEKVIKGAMSLESMTFSEHLLKVIPSGYDDARFMLALSVGSLGSRVGTEAPLLGLEYALRAFMLVLDELDEKLKSKTARQLMYAKNYVYYWVVAGIKDRQINVKARQAQYAAHDLLSAECPEITYADLSDEQLLRLGQMAYHAKDLLKDAETFFSVVIERSPADPAGYFGRAKTGNNMFSHEGVIADSTICIKLIAPESEDIQADSAHEIKDVYQILDYLASAPERRSSNYMLYESFVLRGNAYLSMGNNHRAEFDGRTAVGLNPDNFQGYMIVATSLKESDRSIQALPFYHIVRQLAPHPHLEEGMRSLMEGIKDQAAQSGKIVYIGKIKQSTILFRSVEDFREFKKNVAIDQTFKPEEQNFMCILPKDTLIIVQGKENNGCLQIEADMSLFEGTRWSKALLKDEYSNWVVMGFVLEDTISLFP